MNGINTEIVNFHKDLIEVINNHNNLPVSVIFFILKDCFNEVSAAYNKVLQEEAEQNNKEQSEVVE